MNVSVASQDSIISKEISNDDLRLQNIPFQW